jgi:putative ABC transport system permease protein
MCATVASSTASPRSPATPPREVGVLRESILLAGASARSRRPGGLAATALVIALASVGMSAGLAVVSQGAPLLDEAADDADVAHLVLYGEPSALAEAAASAEVVAAAGPFRTRSGLELETDDDPIPLQLVALDDPDVAVNHPPITAGRWPGSEDEIILDRSLATDIGVEAGDRVTVLGGDGPVELAVTGTAVNFTDCFYPMCDPGRAWVTEDGLDRFGTTGDEFAQSWFRFADAADADPFVEQLASSGVEGIGGSDSWLDTRDDFLALDRVFGSFLAAFGVFVLVCAAVVVAGATAVRVVARRREIGLLGAIGCRPREIAVGIVIENVALGIVAATVGWALAGFAVPSLQVGIAATLGPQGAAWPLMSLVLTVLCIAAVLTIATLVPALRASRRPVTDVLRDVPRGGASRLSRRIAGVPERLSAIGVQEAVSQPVRTVLAALAIVVAVVGTIASIGFVGAIEGVADEPARQGDPWDLTVSTAGIAPDEAERALDAAPSVDHWYAEVERRSTLDEGAFLSVAVGGDLGDAGYVIAGGRTVERPGEAIAGYGFLQRFGREVGDRVDVLVGTTPLSLVIVGWYRDNEDSGEVLRYPLSDLAAATDVEPDLYRVRLAGGADAAAVAEHLRQALGPQARVAAVDTGIDDMQPFFLALRLIAAILLTVAGVNLLTTLLAANHEAAGRIGVELALGFTPRQIVAQGAVAGATVGVLAIAAGVPLGLAVFRVMADVVSTGIGAGPGWMPLPRIVPIVILGVATVALASAVGAMSVVRLVRCPASDLVRAE